MRISPIGQSNQNNQTNFQARVDKRFAKDIYRYCQKRVLPIQLEKFEKKLGELGDFGSKNSVFVHRKLYDGDNKTQIMIFKNPTINPKEGVVVFKSHRFGDFINYILSVSKRDVTNYENILKA